VHSVKCREDVLFNKKGRDCVEGENAKERLARMLSLWMILR
jgi:hypothetical protein